MADFDVAIRKSPIENYLKVFLRDEARLEEVQAFLERIPSIRIVNITKNQRLDLTVYPTRTYSIEEVFDDVIASLKSFFDGSPIDPIIKDETLESISEVAYHQIIEKIYYFGKNLEKYKGLYDKFDEPGFRDFFLPYLNSISESHVATGETFNKIGKTDILIQNTKGENVFIAECKLWKGESELLEAIDQLFVRYVTWRDEKTSIIVFNKTVKGFSEILKKAVAAIMTHPLFYKYKGSNHDTTFSFVLKNNEDAEKLVEMELIMFNCY